MTRIVKAILNGYYRLIQVVMTVLMGVMVIPVTLQILSRYTGWIPRYIWTEEAARFCFLWIIMTGATVAIRDGTHFNVDVLPHPRTARGQAVGQILVDFFLLIVAVAFVVYGYDYAKFGYFQTSELTGINLVWIYGVYFVAGLTWVVFLGERFLKAIRLMREKDHDAR
jgi:TRAP-type C4-dicarboxylate transport system permease small subunit